MHLIAIGQSNLDRLRAYYAWNDKAYPVDIMRMTFVSHHDKNAWEGTEFEQFGDALEAAIVLSVMGEGMPLIYNGQEAESTKRLKFFEKDPIQWKESIASARSTKSCLLKKERIPRCGMPSGEPG